MAYTTIDDPTIYFNTILWTGNGNSSRSITGVGFAPDMVWMKPRSLAYGHIINDTVRGIPNNIVPNSNAAADTSAHWRSFDSDGFTISNGAAINQNNGEFVAWAWKAGNTWQSNTNGTIQSLTNANNRE